jgi:guanidinoacetate N-methyltransferase
MNGTEKLIISSDEIRIDGLTKDYVMHKGEKSLMDKLAEIATMNGGDILEIGFGMHISADAIQSNPNVKSHTIIEVHPEIYKHALIWAKDKPNTEIILGDWIDIIPTLDKKFDGVLHDTHRDKNIFIFLDYIKPKCKNGTIVSFFTLPILDIRFNSYRHELSHNEKEALPYNSNSAFRHNYELKYTTFNGTEFVKNKNIKGLI